MKAKELVPAFSAMTGLPVESVKVADRALADAGMRAKGRGPKPPEVTMQDVIRLTLGVTGSPTLSRANEYVAEAVNFRPFTTSIIKGEQPQQSAAMKELIGLTWQEAMRLNLLEALAKTCIHLTEPHSGHGKPQWSDVSMKVRVSGPVIFRYAREDFEGELHFTGPLEKMENPGVTRFSRVSRSVLRWIGEFESRVSEIAD